MKFFSEHNEKYNVARKEKTDASCDIGISFFQLPPGDHPSNSVQSVKNVEENRSTSWLKIKMNSNEEKVLKIKTFPL